MGDPTPPPSERTYPPTAVQAEAELHETAFSELSVSPGGFSVVWSVHLVPFQASAAVVELG
jgi:hypothetical protein